MNVATHDYDIEEPIAYTPDPVDPKENSMEHDNQNYVEVEVETDIKPLPRGVSFTRLFTMLRGNAKTKRHTLIIPEVLYDHLQYLADAQNTNIQQLIRQFIKLGIIAERASEIDPNAMLFLRINNKDIPLAFVSS